jgi:hypothetical protein
VAAPDPGACARLGASPMRPVRRLLGRAASASPGGVTTRAHRLVKRRAAADLSPPFLVCARCACPARRLLNITKAVEHRLPPCRTCRQEPQDSLVALCSGVGVCACVRVCCACCRRRAIAVPPSRPAAATVCTGPCASPGRPRRCAADTTTPAHVAARALALRLPLTACLTFAGLQASPSWAPCLLARCCHSAPSAYGPLQRRAPNATQI